MVDNVGGNGKEWFKLKATTENPVYKKAVDKEVASILGWNKTISVKNLRENSIFSNLSKDAEERFNDIAKIDGDASTFSADELRVLYALADAKLENEHLKNEQFRFDLNMEIDGNSALEKASSSEVNTIIKNLVSENIRKRTETLNTTKYDRTIPFADKIQSDDVDEVMLAMQDKLSVGINNATGKPISVLQAASQLMKYSLDEDPNKGSQAFTQETGLKVSNVALHNSVSFKSFKIGDWEYQRSDVHGGIMINSKTGEKLHILTAPWRNTTTHTIPATNGYFTYIKSYSDGNGTSLQFKYDDDENVAPTSAIITANGQSKTVNYNQKLIVDPNIYNFADSDL